MPAIHEKNPSACRLVHRRMRLFRREAGFDARLVPLRVHAALHALTCERRFVFGADKRVLHAIRNGSAAFVDVEPVDVLQQFARRTRLAPWSVRAEQAVNRSGSFETPKCWRYQRRPPGAAETMPTGS